MNSGEIGKLTEKALQYLNSAEAFASKQVPAYIEELLTFKVFEHSLNLLLSISVILLMGYIILKFKNYFFGDYNEDLGHHDMPPVVAVGLTSLIPCIIIFFHLGDIKVESVNVYKAAKAPRVYLVDYFTQKVGK